MQLAPEGANKPMTRVLLVDDQQDVLRVMQLILARQYDYCVETASSGQQALEHVEAFAPDVIISDLSMPDMDGCELMMQLRENSHLPPFKSIALSGYGADQQKTSLEAGYDAHLVKPVDYDNLTKIIDQLMQESN